MRIKSFTLVEIVVVIILLGIVYSLGLTAYNNINQKKRNIYNIKEFQKNLPEGSIVFYSYSKECKKSGVLLKNGDFIRVFYPVFNKEDKMLAKNRYGNLETVEFEPEKLKGKTEKICIKIKLKNGDFTDKFILSYSNRYYLFLPFYQEIEEFETEEKAKEAYFHSLEYPLSKDGFYNE